MKVQMSSDQVHKQMMRASNDEPSKRPTTSHGNLIFDEVERCGTILRSITVVSCSVTTVAAVWIRRIAVRLDLTCRGTRETSWSGSKLRHEVSKSRKEMHREAYALRYTGSDLVRKALDIPRVAHKDCGLDLVDSRGLNGNRCVRVPFVRVAAAAEGVIHDLTALSRNLRTALRSIGNHKEQT